jgi:hypothetical protein
MVWKPHKPEGGEQALAVTCMFIEGTDEPLLATGRLEVVEDASWHSRFASHRNGSSLGQM